MVYLFFGYWPNSLKELFQTWSISYAILTFFSRGVEVEDALQPPTDDALMYSIVYATDSQEASPNYMYFLLSPTPRAHNFKFNWISLGLLG